MKRHAGLPQGAFEVVGRRAKEIRVVPKDADPGVASMAQEAAEALRTSVMAAAMVMVKMPAGLSSSLPTRLGGAAYSAQYGGALEPIESQSDSVESHSQEPAKSGGARSRNSLLEAPAFRKNRSVDRHAAAAGWPRLPKPSLAAHHQASIRVLIAAVVANVQWFTVTFSVRVSVSVVAVCSVFSLNIEPVLTRLLLAGRAIWQSSLVPRARDFCGLAFRALIGRPAEGSWHVA